MGETSNRALDRAQELALSEAVSGVAAASAALAAEGRETCLDCERPIPIARRQAIPSAKRCVRCQKLSEGAR